MTHEEAPARRDDTDEPLIIVGTRNGFRVYSPTGRTRPYYVAGIPEAPTCTCPSFKVDGDDPDFRCPHIQAVLERCGAHSQASTAIDRSDDYEREERAAMRDEGALPAGNGHSSHMTLKRSISPDGRIDSLSIEFTAPVNGDAVKRLESRASEILGVQSRIVDQFLETNNASGKKNGKARREDGAEQAEAGDQSGEPVVATLIDIAGMDGKWGRRLFLRIDVEGRVLRYFGNKTQLADALTESGYRDRASQVREGLKLNLPCRVVTSPSQDGRFVNVDRVLPIRPLQWTS